MLLKCCGSCTQRHCHNDLVCVKIYRIYISMLTLHGNWLNELRCHKLGNHILPWLLYNISGNSGGANTRRLGAALLSLAKLAMSWAVSRPWCTSWPPPGLNTANNGYRATCRSWHSLAHRPQCTLPSRMSGSRPGNFLSSSSISAVVSPK
jgi:hypothetical protein